MVKICNNHNTYTLSEIKTYMVQTMVHLWMFSITAFQIKLKASVFKKLRYNRTDRDMTYWGRQVFVVDIVLATYSLGTQQL